MRDSSRGAGFSLGGASAPPDDNQAMTPHASAAAATGSDEQFASQLRGLRAQDVDPQPLTTNPEAEQGKGETADETAANASDTNITDSAATLDRQFRMTSGSWVQQFAVTPQVARPSAGAVDPARPQPTTKQAPKTLRAQAASSESAQTAPVAVVLPTPTPEIAASTDAATTGDSINNEDFDVAAKAHTPHGATEAPEPGEAAPPMVTAAGPQAQSQEMAFATRVQPVQSTEHSALPAEMASAGAVASASKKVVAADAETAPSADAHTPLATAITTVEPRAELATTSSPAAHAAPATHSAEPPADPAENLTKATTPLKDISLQVNQPGNERVDIRVVQQGNEVHVSVHSGDSSLTSGLRQGLSELQSKLEETGYRSEMWRPGASAPVAAAPASQESGNHPRGGDGQPQQGGSQQDSGRRNQNQSNRNQSNQNQSSPRWVEALKSSVGEEKSSGGFYGFTS